MKPIDHVALTAERLLDQYKEDPTLNAIVLVPATQSNELETVFFSVMEDIWIDTAEGAQLDLIGRIVNRPRGPLNDADYRIALYAEVALLRCSGTIEQIYKVFQTLEPGADFGIKPWFPAKFQFDWLSPPITGSVVDQYAVILKRAKAGGVGVYFYWYPAPEDELFGFASIEPGDEVPWGDGIWGDFTWGGEELEAEFSDTQGFADTAQTTGGKLAGLRFVGGP